MQDTVTASLIDGVGRLTLNRPQAHNAITIELACRLEEQVRALASAAAVIVIGGAVPVIAAVQGFAVAGGFELALASDIVLVSQTASLADIHSNYGMVPGGGSSQRLPRLVGAQRALALILSGETLTGEQAVQWGIAYRAIPDAQFETGVAAFAAALAAKDRSALARSKRLIRDGLQLPLSDGLALELAAVLDHLDGGAVYSKGSA